MTESLVFIREDGGAWNDETGEAWHRIALIHDQIDDMLDLLGAPNVVELARRNGTLGFGHGIRSRLINVNNFLRRREYMHSANKDGETWQRVIDTRRFKE